MKPKANTSELHGSLDKYKHKYDDLNSSLFNSVERPPEYLKQIKRPGFKFRGIYLPWMKIESKTEFNFRHSNES